VSIGQGALLATPLQMAMFVAALANGGYVFRPKIAITGNGEGELVKRMPWSAAALNTVRGGMYDVVESDTGTGKRARLVGVHMGGKTGTAEYGTTLPRKKHVWMLAFAPFEHPRCAAVIMLENGISGGVEVAPRMGKLMGSIFGVPTLSEATAAAAAAAQTQSDEDVW
jgi:penicillin-binding protein 2